MTRSAAPDQPARLAGRRHPPAFTLPEVLLAVVLLAVGILGLASSATAIAVQAGDARAMTTGASLLGAVLDSLRSGDCHAIGAGSRSDVGVHVSWTVTPSTRSTAVHATLQTSAARHTRSFTVDALLPCDP